MGVLVDNKLIPQATNPEQSLLNYAATLSPEEGLSQHPGEAPPNLSQAILHALGEVGKAKFNALMGAVTLPYEVYTGKVNPFSEEGFRRAQGMTGLMASGAMPMAEESAAGIFGGRLAQTRPRIVDKVTGDVGSYGSVGAVKQLESGVSPNKVFDKTGWFMGKDGKPRFEIDDKNMGWNYDPVPGTTYKLGEVLNHPALFSAYPQLKNINYKEDPALENTATHGHIMAWLDNSFAIAVKPSLSDEEKNRTVLHELQHAVQNIEGFAKGSAVPVYSPHPEMQKEMKSVFDEFYNLATKHNFSEQERDRYKQLFQYIDDYTTFKESLEKTAYQNYYNLAGETEARNVENRYSNQFLNGKYPWTTEFPPRILQKLTPVDYNPFENIKSIKEIRKEQ